MWILLCLLSTTLFQPALASFLSRSDPLCRDESFFFYWMARYSHERHDHSSYDITGKCDFYPQMWYLLVSVFVFIGWLTAFAPAVVNFIEGVERREICCEDVDEEN